MSKIKVTCAGGVVPGLSYQVYDNLPGTMTETPFLQVTSLGSTFTVDKEKLFLVNVYQSFVDEEQ